MTKMKNSAEVLQTLSHQKMSLLRSCADLYRLYKEGVLDIQPEFQREVV